MPETDPTAFKNERVFGPVLHTLPETILSGDASGPGALPRTEREGSG